MAVRCPAGRPGRTVRAVESHILTTDQILDIRAVGLIERPPSDQIGLADGIARPIEQIAGRYDLLGDVRALPAQMQTRPSKVLEELQS